MAEEPENLVLEHLRFLRSDLSDVKQGMTVVRQDIREIKVQMSAALQLLGAHDNRITELESRLELVEKRLELRDH